MAGNGQWVNWNSSQSTPNIGWCTAGSSGCIVSSPAGTINYYASSNTNMSSPSNISFVGSAQFMNLSFSYNAANIGPGVDTVGYYTLTPQGSVGIMVPIFSTANSTNSNVLLAVSAGADYGFYIENTQGGTNTFDFMDSGLNTSNSGATSSTQNFALYDSVPADTYFIGIGNPAVSSDASAFNAFMITATYPSSAAPTGNPPAPAPAPEPSSLPLAVVGLAALTFALRKRL